MNSLKFGCARRSSGPIRISRSTCSGIRVKLVGISREFLSPLRIGDGLEVDLDHVGVEVGGKARERGAAGHADSRCLQAAMFRWARSRMSRSSFIASMASKL